MSPEEYESVWSDLPTPTTSTELEATEVGASTGVWVAHDRTGRRHLLVQVASSVDLSGEGTRGLAIETTKHRIAGRTDALYIDLSCTDPAVAPTFAAVAADVATDVIGASLDDRADLVTAAVREWRWFWGVDAAAITAPESIGLFGELWFLNRWAGVTSASIDAWEGSDGARHDYQWPKRSVEVKTTARSGPVVHRIEHLDQLADPVTGDLYLYSLRIVKDALAANSVHTLAQSAIASVSTKPAVRTDLLRKLASRGYNPTSRLETAVTYRVAEETLYRVSAGFPRLTSESFLGDLPHGVVQLSYRIEMSVCDTWRVPLVAEEWPP